MDPPWIHPSCHDGNTYFSTSFTTDVPPGTGCCVTGRRRRMRFSIRRLASSMLPPVDDAPVGCFPSYVPPPDDAGCAPLPAPLRCAVLVRCLVWGLPFVCRALLSSLAWLTPLLFGSRPKSFPLSSPSSSSSSRCRCFGVRTTDFNN